MASIWTLESEFPQMETLKEDKSTQVVVIGAGMVGLLTAYLLHQENVDTIVLEASKVASGQTKNTTAKITSQHNLTYDNLIKDFGEEIARGYAMANEEAIKSYAEIIKKDNISCHFKKEPAYVYSINDATKIEKEVIAANKVGIKAKFTQKVSIPIDVKGSVKFPNQASFNPLEFLKEIIKPLTIYEDTMVRAIEDDKVITDKGVVAASHIVIASHYPFLNTPGYYFLRMHQERSYVIGLENAAKLDGMYIDEAENGFSFRNYDDKLILGGLGHRTGENKYGGYYDVLRSKAVDLFPGSREICHWSAQDCITVDQVPYIGRYSSSTHHIYVATGFKKWGMTTSMVSAKLIRDLILSRDNPYEEVFNPQRFKITASIKTLNEEVKNTAKGLLIDKLKIPKKTIDTIKKGSGEIVEYNGMKIGIYKDEEGKTYSIFAKCSHLGCELKWNQDELTWDCPCHGSRFDYTGKLIDNPAKDDIKIIEK